MSGSIASSPYRLADSHVLIAVAMTERGPEPLCAQAGDEIVAVAYTDPAEAKADAPDTHRVFSIQVAELLEQLPAGMGVVIDPRSPSPVHVPAAARPALIDAARPFPPGAEVRIGDPMEEPVELLEALRSVARGAAQLRRLWRTWYQAADAPPKLLLVYEGGTPDDTSMADAVVGVVEQSGYPHPTLVMAVDDLPEAHREWLLANTAPFFERSA